MAKRGSSSVSLSSGAMDCYVTVKGHTTISYEARQFNGAVDCYVTVKGLSVGQERTSCQNRTHNSQPLQERAIQRGDGPLRNGSIIWEAAHYCCRVATDCAGGDSDCASPCN
eukprot:311190-Prymnesium_polylepis.1